MRGRAARRQRPLGWLGTLSGAYGIGIVAAGAMLGAVITVVQREDPGAVLGVLLVLGTILAGLAVRARSARLIIPAPVFCYVPAAVIAGAINDRSVDTSKIDLVIHGGKWISSGFTAMTFATIVAIVMTGARLFLDYRTRPRARRGPAPRPAPRTRYQPGQGEDMDGVTRPIGQVGPAPTGPIAGRPDGRGSGSYPRPQGPAGYPHPQPQGSGGHPQPHGSGGYPRPQGSGPYAQPQPQPPRQLPGPGPGPAGTGPYQQPPASGGYPPR